MPGSTNLLQAIYKIDRLAHLIRSFRLEYFPQTASMDMRPGVCQSMHPPRNAKDIGKNSMIKTVATLTLLGASMQAQVAVQPSNTAESANVIVQWNKKLL